MKVTVWGARGSLATPGPDTVRYGGNTTCLEVRLKDNTLIIIDAGSGLRLLGNKLLREDSTHEIFMFLTHTHWDHIMGFPFFRPAFMDKYSIKVFSGPNGENPLQYFLSTHMGPPYFPVDFGIMKAAFDFKTLPARKFSIGPAEIELIGLSHPDGGYGLKIVEDGKSFVFLTDNEIEHFSQPDVSIHDYLLFARDADLLIHDAQYTQREYSLKKGWGHSSFQAAADFSIQAGAQKLGLFHHDPDHTDDDIDLFVSVCQDKFAAARKEIDCFGAREGMEIEV